MSRGVFEKHSAKLSLLIGMIVVVFAFAAIELGLGLIDRGAQLVGNADQGTKRHIRFREHLPLSSTTHRFVAANSEEHLFLLWIDEDGFIVPSSIHEDPDLSIVFLGGSTTECLLMEGEERFPYLAGRYIERDGPKVNSYNGGVGGNDTMHSINILLNKVLPMDPDYVVLMHNINDLVPLMCFGTYWNDTPTRSLVVAGEPPSPLQHLYEAAKKAAQSIVPNTHRALKSMQDGFEKGPAEDEWQALRGKDLEIDDERIKEAFRRSLLTFIHIARDYSIVPILMTQARRSSLSGVPEETRDRWVLRTKLFDEFNQIIRQVGDSERVHVIDLNRLVPRDVEDMYDSIHFSPKGSDFVTKAVARYFEQNILLN